MSKGSRPDKQNMVMGMFSKIARESKRLDKKRIKDAKRKGEFYYIEHPELLSINEQFKYFKAKDVYERGDNTWLKEYDRTSSKFPFPYKFIHGRDK